MNILVPFLKETSTLPINSIMLKKKNPSFYPIYNVNKNDLISQLKRCLINEINSRYILSSPISFKEWLQCRQLGPVL
jgi:hypothetical protein